MCTQYNSISTSNSDKKTKQNPVSQLALDSFAAFKPFINVLDCGLAYQDSVFHLITKQDWQFHRRYKQGERGLVYPNGRKFNPFLDIIRSIYSAEHVQRHIEAGEGSYFTSGKRGLGLLYLDTDAHKAWQTDEYAAKALLQDLFPFGYYRASRRGQNGYLKIRYDTFDEFNDLANRLEETLHWYFLSQGILCDFETKGTITHDISGSLAKFPFGTHRYACDMRDETDNWDYAQLEKFEACPIVNTRRIEQIMGQIQIDEAKAVAFAQHKRSLDKEEQAAEEAIFAMMGLDAEDKERFFMMEVFRPFLFGFHKEYHRPPTTTEALEHLRSTGKYKGRLASAEASAAGRSQAIERKPITRSILPKPATQPKPAAVPCSLRANMDLPPMESDDAFRRNHEDLRPFVRAFYFQERRYPTTEEALDWLHANGRYSGEWEDREDRRAKRVGQILDFLEPDFDPEMLGSGKPSVSLELGRFRWWVEQKFGMAMTVDWKDISRFDPATMTAPTSTIAVPARFVDHCLTVVEFCVKTDPLSNRAVPTNRIEKDLGNGQRWCRLEPKMVSGSSGQTPSDGRDSDCR